MKNLLLLHIRSTKTTLACFLCFFSFFLTAQPSLDVNSDGTVNILILGTGNSIEPNFDEFSPVQISTELQSILASDPLISQNINVVSEDIYRMKTVSTGIAGQFTANRDYHCHSLTQYYYWPDNRTSRINNLKGNNGVDWDYVVIGADPYLVAKMPGYYSLGVNKIASLVHDGGAVPLLLMEWTKDTTLINHFEEYTYRTAGGAIVPLEVVPAGLAWQSLPPHQKDTAGIHPTPNGSYTAAATIYSTLLKRSASMSQYTYNDSIADAADIARVNAANQTHYTGKPTFVSPYKSCEISDTNLIYNHGGTSTENGILNGLNWVVAANQKTLQFGSTAPIHFNYGRSSMGSTHLYQIDSTRFDYSFGYPLQDDASTGLITMQYGIDKRASSTDVETDLGTARQMVNNSELPFARNVPLRTIISQMIEQIPGVLIYPIGDPWHLSNDVNKAIGSYIYTILTSDCTIRPSDTICLDSAQWRSWMAHKIGQETAWNVMYLEGANSCNKSIHVVNSCSPYAWINGITYNSSTSTATHTFTNMAGCDSVVILNLTYGTANTLVTQSGATLTASQSGANYQWIDCSNGVPINGANNRSFTPSASGNYAVIVSQNGCSDTSSCYNVIAVGANEHHQRNKPKIYPNPTHGNVSIDLGKNYQNVSVTVRNSLGQEVLLKTFYSTSIINLDIPGAPGLYFIAIAYGNHKEFLKLIKGK